MIFENIMSLKESKKIVIFKQTNGKPLQVISLHRQARHHKTPAEKKIKAIKLKIRLKLISYKP